MRPVESCGVAKLALPRPRLSISRPATETATCSGSIASFSRWPYLRASSAARSRGLKSFGKATPRARIAASLARRSAMRAFSSAFMEDKSREFYRQAPRGPAALGGLDLAPLELPESGLPRRAAHDPRSH